MNADSAPLPPGALSAHLESMRRQGRAESTIVKRRRHLAAMAAAIPVPLLEAAHADLAAWRAGLQVTGNTAVQYAAHARSFYAWAVKEGLIEQNPCDGLELPPMVRGLPRPCDEETLMEALDTAPPRVRPWLVLAGWAGLRAKEIALLRRERVLDTADPPVLLVASDATKGNRERIVPLSPFVVAELRTAGLPRGGWVFPRADGQPGPNKPWVVSHTANAHLRSCGTGVTLHQLRHRFGTQAYRACHDLRTVQELLGHADPATTAGYAAYDRGAAVEVVGKIPAPQRLVPVRRIKGARSA